jgi:hypothetical protein
MGAKKHPDTLRAMALFNKGGFTIATIAGIYNLAPSTLYRALFPEGKKKEKKRLALRERQE